MNHAFKSISVTLMLTLALNSSLGQRHIIELSLDPKTNKLIDPGTTRVNKGDYVLWQIKANENILSFGIEGAQPPFSSPLPNGSNYSEIGRTVSGRGDWKYKIFYTLKADPGTLLYLDPKIAINPAFRYMILVIFVAVTVIAIATLVFFRQKAKISK